MIINQQTYQKEILPALKKEFGIKNSMAVPRLRKIVVNMGVSDPPDPKQRKQAIDNIADQFKIMTGQKPKLTKARQSIATFKLRVGDPLGVVVTLRGKRMWQFFNKLISVALPRVKDFRGVSKTAFDGQGNFSLGLEEQIVFPEIEYDKIERVRSLQVTFVTTAQSDEQSRRLLELFGMPFVKEDK
ncbi:MAG: 50S ribosomal protein L5 [Patescibacteria group bacterium]|nr:50S ribosomal protein L5 [Patescibacteria group bacterium]